MAAPKLGKRPAITPLRGAEKVCPDGTQVVAGTPLQIVEALAGCSRWRLRIKTNGAGTLSAAYRRPGTIPVNYEDNNPADVAVLANDEISMDVDFHWGEEAVEITFTATAGTVTIGYMDLMRV